MYSRDDRGIWGDVDVLQAKQILPEPRRSLQFGRPDACDIVQSRVPLSAVRPTFFHILSMKPRARWDLSHLWLWLNGSLRPSPSASSTVRRHRERLSDRIKSLKSLVRATYPFEKLFASWSTEGFLVALPRKGVRVASLDPESVVEISLMRAALRRTAPKTMAGW